MGIKDANNMGAAMAPAFVDTLISHFHDTGRSPSYYDAIISGDLGHIGKEIAIDIAKSKGYNIKSNYNDCRCIGIYHDCCGSSTASAVSELTAESKPATQYTIDANQEVYALLDFEDTAEFENATKGLLASPDTANPSLWRDTQLNHIYGLFEVTDGIYQVRGYDMSNVTFIKGDTGWIVVDPLMSVECAQAALALVEENLGTFPVKAVIYSHSHIDHFGGVKGIVSEEEV